MAKKLQQFKQEVEDDAKKAGQELEELTHLAVRALRDGFRRAGRAWSKTVQVIAKADLTAEQIAALKAEPALSVTEVAAPTDAPTTVETTTAPAAAPAPAANDTAAPAPAAQTDA